MRTKPKRVLFAIQLNHLHLNDQRVCLPSGPVGDLFAQSTALDAPLDSVSLQLEVDIDAYKPERVAYEIAREVYVWFGHSEEHIPYAMGSGDERRIDFAQIVRIG